MAHDMEDFLKAQRGQGPAMPAWMYAASPSTISRPCPGMQAPATRAAAVLAGLLPRSLDECRLPVLLGDAVPLDTTCPSNFRRGSLAGEFGVLLLAAGL